MKPEAAPAPPNEDVAPGAADPDMTAPATAPDWPARPDSPVCPDWPDGAEQQHPPEALPKGARGCKGRSPAACLPSVMECPPAASPVTEDAAASIPPSFFADSLDMCRAPFSPILCPAYLYYFLFGLIAKRSPKKRPACLPTCRGARPPAGPDRGWPFRCDGPCIPETNPRTPATANSRRWPRASHRAPRPPP